MFQNSPKKKNIGDALGSVETPSAESSAVQVNHNETEPFFTVWLINGLLIL